MNNVYYVESIKDDWINIIVLKEWGKGICTGSKKNDEYTIINTLNGSGEYGGRFRNRYACL